MRDRKPKIYVWFLGFLVFWFPRFPDSNPANQKTSKPHASSGFLFSEQQTGDKQSTHGFWAPSEKLIGFRGMQYLTP
jgi:hypothetical protein